MIPSESSNDDSATLGNEKGRGHFKSQMSGRSSDGHLDSGIGPHGTPEYLAVGRVLGPWGIKGEVKTEILTDSPDRFGLLKTVYLGDKLEPLQLERYRLHKRFVLLKFEGIDERNGAGRLRGKLVQIPIEEALPLEEGIYYVHEIVGLGVWTIEGEYLGLIDEVLFTGGNEVYVVKGPHKDILIPAIADVVQDVDLETGRLTVRLLQGLR